MRSSNRQREGGQKCSSLGCHSSGTKRRPLDSVVSVRGKVRTFVEENEQEKFGWCGIYGIFFLIYFISFFICI